MPNQMFWPLATPERSLFLAAAPRMDGQGQQRQTRSGVPQWTISLFVVWPNDGGTAAIDVVVEAASQPQLSEGQTVAVQGLVLLPWNQGNRSGVALRASSVAPAQPVRAAREAS